MVSLAAQKLGPQHGLLEVPECMDKGIYVVFLCRFADEVPTVSVDRSRSCAEVLETRQVCEKECQIILSVSLILVKGPNYMLGPNVSDAYLIQPYRNNPVEVLFLGHCCCILTLKIECYNSNNYVFISLCKSLQ